MKSTKELARELGLLRKRPTAHSDLAIAKKPKNSSDQLFSYLIIIDFESTCWEDRQVKYGQEIIEFPAVLLNTNTGVLESEFQQYVQPSEHPRLSSFCQQLTGISQDQVDAGIPIGVCIRLFMDWLQEMKQQKGLAFPYEVSSGYRNTAGDKNLPKWCTIVTWSDWDLNVCLRSECRRKSLRHPPELKSWIDLRSVYKKFYSRKPQGLEGALNDVGISFSGRQHSGIDDARNTAKLAWRMICDGCIMSITGAIDRKPTDLMAAAVKYISNPADTLTSVQTNPKTKSTNQEQVYRSGVSGIAKTCNNQTNSIGQYVTSAMNQPANSGQDWCRPVNTNQHNTGIFKIPKPLKSEHSLKPKQHDNNQNICKSEASQQIIKTDKRHLLNGKDNSNEHTGRKISCVSEMKTKHCILETAVTKQEYEKHTTSKMKPSKHEEEQSEGLENRFTSYMISESGVNSFGKPSNLTEDYECSVTPDVNLQKKQIDELKEVTSVKTEKPSDNVKGVNGHPNDCCKTTAVKSVMNIKTSVFSPMIMNSSTATMSASLSLLEPLTSMKCILKEGSPLDHAASLQRIGAVKNAYKSKEIQKDKNFEARQRREERCITTLAGEDIVKGSKSYNGKSFGENQRVCIKAEATSCPGKENLSNKGVSLKQKLDNNQVPSEKNLYRDASSNVFQTPRRDEIKMLNIGNNLFKAHTPVNTNKSEVNQTFSGSKEKYRNIPMDTLTSRLEGSTSMVHITKFALPTSNRTENRQPLSFNTPTLPSRRHSMISNLTTTVATPPLTAFNGGKITPPFCSCGRRARRRTVINPGPNQGRVFYVCTGNTTKPGLGNSRCNTGCGYFKWQIETAVKREGTPLTARSCNKTLSSN